MSEEPDIDAKKPRKPKEPTVKWLRDQALRYLNRFPATTTKMRQHLYKKAEPNLEFFELSENEVLGNIDQVIDTLVQAGFMNDTEFAASKARVMSRQGKSLKQIQLKLQELGFSEELVEKAISALGEDIADLDLKAAARFVKRRKFGPYKPKESRQERREKELASLARQGFSYGVATRVLEASTITIVEKIISPDSSQD